jgi:hypothetical protein
LAFCVPSVQGYIYGSNESAVIYTYDARRQIVSVELAIIAGEPLGVDS